MLHWESQALLGSVPARDPNPAMFHLSSVICPPFLPPATPPSSFQQRVERFHESPGVRELPPETYISRTITLVNCGPPLR